MPKCIEPMSNKNNITCGCKTCIISLLLQLDINKWRISQISKLDQLYINYTSTRLIETSKNDLIEYNKQIFPNDSHIYLRACDAASSYHCPPTIIGSKIPRWDCILNFCSDCTMMNAPFLEPPEQLDHLFPASLYKIKFHI